MRRILAALAALVLSCQMAGATVSTTENTAQYAGNGTTTAFSFPYPYFQPTDLVVGVTVTATGAADPACVPVLNGGGTCGYTVTGVTATSTANNVSEYGSATLAFNTAPPASDTLTIQRIEPATQLLNEIDNAKNPSGSRNAAFDKLTMLVQQALAQLALTVQMPATDAAGLSCLLVPAQQRASLYLAFDANGNCIALPPPAGPSGGDVSLYTAVSQGAPAARTLAQHLGYVLQPQDFAPAACSGADDQATLAAWAAALATTGSKGLILTGTCLTDGLTITGANPVHIEIDPGATLKATSGASGAVLTMAAPGSVVDGGGTIDSSSLASVNGVTMAADGVSLRNLTFIGGGTSAYPVYCLNASRCDADHDRVVANGNVALFANATDGATHTDVRFADNLIDRSTLAPGSVAQADILIGGNNAGGTNSYFDRGFITRNTVLLPTGSGCCASSAIGIEVTNTGGTSNYLPVSHLVVAENIAEGGSMTYSLAACGSCVAASNIGFSPYDYGLELGPSTNTVAVGNILDCDGNGADGVVEDTQTTTSAHVIAANAVIDCTAAQATQAGANGVQSVIAANLFVCPATSAVGILVTQQYVSLVGNATAGCGNPIESGYAGSQYLSVVGGVYRGQTSCTSCSVVRVNPGSAATVDYIDMIGMVAQGVSAGAGSDGSFITANPDVSAWGTHVQGYSDIGLLEPNGNYPIDALDYGNALFRGYGSGSPASKFQASPGSQYLNEAGGSATSLYQKESGSVTSTGWVGK